MEITSCSVVFPKSRIRVLFSIANFFQLLLIFTIFITTSTSITQESSLAYSKYCNGVVEESQSTGTQFSADNFLRLDKAAYSLGFENPKFNFNPVSNQVASFSIRKAYVTKSKGVVMVNAVLNLEGPVIIKYFSDDVPRRGLRLVKVRPPKFEPRTNFGAEFRLFGFWNSDSGSLCMVGSGSVTSLRSVNVVFKLDYPKSSVLDKSLINGTLQSIQSAGTATYFKPVSILGVSRMGYDYTFIDKEIKNGAFRVYDDMENVSLSLPVKVGELCSIITWGLRFELDYDNYDCKNVSCSFGSVGDEIFPRFMSIKVIDCLDGGKVRYVLQFSNSTFDKSLSFYPLTSLVAEGKWDEKKRLVLVACQLFDKNPLRGCSIRVAFSFPSTLSLKHRSSIVGKIWSMKTKNLGYVSFYSPANLNSRIKGASYEYKEHEKVQDLCRESLENKRKKGTYPDDRSPSLRFDMMVKNKKGEIAYGYTSPLYIRDKLYKAFGNERPDLSSNGYMNISYVITFNTREEFDFGGKIRGSYTVEISAEGVYNPENGVACMVGCKHMPYKKFRTKRSLDCELVININYSPLNSKDAGTVRGSIKSTRKKPDPLHFEPIEFGSSSITTIQARESIWRMDLEITMVLISNTLACISIGLQLFHVKKNPDSLPFISVFMLVVLTSAHMIPLLLNFEAIFVKQQKQNVFVGTDQWLEVNEVLVRVITMIAFLLHFRLLQLTWSARNSHENRKNLWVCDKKVCYLSFPLYIAIGLASWFAHALRNSQTKTRFHSRSENFTFWGDLKSYTGLVLDAFLIPQIMFNLFSDAHGTVLAPSFYIGSTAIRLLPHVYDLAQTRSSSWFYDKIYANPGTDYYSAIWDVVICCGGMTCVVVVYVQQRWFRDGVLYQKVPVTTPEQQVF